MTDEAKKKIELMYDCVNETYRGGMIQAAEFGYQLGYEEAMGKVAQYFSAMRHDPKHHLGLGDISLTYGQQEEITKVSSPSAS